MMIARSGVLSAQSSASACFSVGLPPLKDSSTYGVSPLIGRRRAAGTATPSSSHFNCGSRLPESIDCLAAKRRLPIERWPARDRYNQPSPLSVGCWSYPPPV